MWKALTSTDVLESIPGGSELLAWFGYVPSFHDAEIIDLHLSRVGASTLRIHTWALNPDQRTYDRPPFKKHVIVTFNFEDIVGLNLDDFSPQNVIASLELKHVKEEIHSFGMTWRDKPPEPPEFYEISLEPLYGLSGTIRARLMSISLTPGKAQDQTTGQK